MYVYKQHCATTHVGERGGEACYASCPSHFVHPNCVLPPPIPSHSHMCTPVSDVSSYPVPCTHTQAHTHCSMHTPCQSVSCLPVLCPFIAASNFLIAIRCGCGTPLTCEHGQSFVVKLADFDSAMDITKLQATRSFHKQLHRNTPSGTPGYRPPEVSRLDGVNSRSNF